MEAALRLSLYGVGLLGALRQSLLASMAVSLVVGVLKKASFSPTRPGAPRRALTGFVLASLRSFEHYRPAVPIIRSTRSSRPPRFRYL